MLKRIFLLSCLVTLCVTLFGASGSPKSWEFLSTTTIGAKAFRDAHPEWDGRGVLIAVCDTGVDLGIPGLLETPDGKPKVIDARVFSSEGKIDLENAMFSKDEKGEAVHGEDGKWLYGYDTLPLKPKAGSKLLIGYFKEEEFQNSSLDDLNGNGRRDDVFGMVAFEAGGGSDAKWVAFVDSDGDGSLAGEKEIGDFTESRQVFSLKGGDTHASAELSRYALNLWPKDKEAAIYMDDGAHGTHVAGIAAGYKIDGQEGYDGIAPGAQLLGLKLGDNTLSGGATTPGSMVSSWEYAIKRAEELKMPLVIQMSFGVGSEDEGSAVAEKLLDELLEKHPGVVATVSAGNEGPGISTVGLPAGMKNALSVGAVLAKSSAKSLYGADLNQDEMFSFSSRGGELAKPDIVCPGFAASTVPDWERGQNNMRGTSMAAPQAAGACALIFSAAKASGLPIRREWLHAALANSSKPLPGYGVLDCGAGQVDVPAAWEAYKKLAKLDPAEPVRFRAETESAEMASGKGPAVHWRGSYFPDSEAQEVVISPVFPSDASADFKSRYYRAFDVVSKADWVRVGKDAVYIKAEQPAKMTIIIDGAKLKRPGLYQTVIEGHYKGAKPAGLDGPAFAVPVSVVVPEEFGSRGDFSIKTKIADLKPAKVESVFFKVTPETASINLDLKLPEPQKGSVSVTLFDPEGREVLRGALRPEARAFKRAIGNPDLEPGIWQITFYANYLNAQPSSVDSNIRSFPAIDFVAESPLAIKPGLAPEFRFRLSNASYGTFRGSLKAAITGYRWASDEKLKKATFKKKFSVLDGESEVVFRFELSPRDFGLFTDIPVQVLDSDGKALVKDGLSYRKGEISFSPPEGASPKDVYTLKVSGATADPDSSSPRWTLKLEEIHLYSSPIALKAKGPKGDALALYPDHPVELGFTADKNPPALPSGACWLAEMSLTSAREPEWKLASEVLLRQEEAKAE